MPLDEHDDIAPGDQSCDMIGDGSQPYALPTLNARNDRFKRIDAATLVKLIDGDFKDTIESFTIVDCRYPYEYQGGHIIDSLNIHTGAELVKVFIDNNHNRLHLHQDTQFLHPYLKPQTTGTGCSSENGSGTSSGNNTIDSSAFTDDGRRTNRRIIIFHCEFSSERGPKLMRLLREKDRQINNYPELCWPELYLLNGGYRDFYRKYKEYCVPQSYKPMNSRNHRDELRSYLKKRKVTNPRRKENRTPDISFEG